MITPTLGRIVWFQPHNDAGLNTQQAAIIARVNDDGSLNLAVFAPDGYPYCIQNVPLLQDDDPTPTGGFYAEWMPYQKGQEAKTEASEAAAAAIPASPDPSASNSASIPPTASTGGTIPEGEPQHESIIERIEDGAEQLKEEVERVFHHDSAEVEQPPTA